MPNRLNQYASVGGTAFAHDANGNLTSDGVYTYEYDEENRLRSAVGGGFTTSYEYDPLGRRRSKTVNGTLTRYVSDNAEEIEERDAAQAILRRYVYGSGIDERIAMLDSACTGGRCFYLTNWQGSTTTLINQTGSTLHATYRYGPYGEGVNWTPADALTGNPFRYTGRRVDPETGLYYYRARYYSPRLGRFLQADPLGVKDEMNLYAYGAGDSVNNVDPTGTTVRIVTRNGGNIGQYKSARGYTGSAPTSISNRTRLLESKLQYTIVVDPQGVPDFDEDSNTVIFNPNSAMRVDAGIQSAALSLEHEIAHAAHRDRVGLDEYKKGEKPPIDVSVEGPETEEGILLDGNFSIDTRIGVSPNEKIATEAEQAISAELGGSDPARDNYSESSARDDTVQVEDPTWHCRNPNCPSDR